MKKIFFLLFFAAGTQVFSALPPLYQSKAEIQAILNSKQLPKYICSGEQIIAIKKEMKGYAIITNKSRVQVDVVYLSHPWIGPLKFKLIFHKPESKFRILEQKDPFTASSKIPE